MTKILLERNRLQTRCSRLSYYENVSVIEPAEVKLMEIVNANCNNKLSIQLVRSLLFEEDPAQLRREP